MHKTSEKFQASSLFLFKGINKQTAPALAKRTEAEQKVIEDYSSI